MMNLICLSCKKSKQANDIYRDLICQTICDNITYNEKKALQHKEPIYKLSCFMDFQGKFNQPAFNGIKKCVFLMALSALIIGITEENVLADANNFQIDGTLPFGDVPYIWTLFRRSPGGEPLPDPAESMLQTYFDTGASGILLSRETREALGISAEPNSNFVDVGVGGEEEFEVSENLYIALADYHPLEEEPIENDFHEDFGPWRLNLIKDYADSPIDIIGIPGMAGKSLVLKIEVLDFFGVLIPYYVTQIMEPNDPSIPELDIEVKVQFTNFLYLSHPNNRGPLPVTSYNPVIEDIQISYQGDESIGDWILDTGAQLSMMSTSQAEILGLVDSNGVPIVTPEFYQAIGGIGGDINVPIFQIDTLSIPTLNGFELIYGNPYVGVLDIGYIDKDTEELVILDGIFGANFLGYSYDMSLNIATGVYNNIVFDTQRAILGFDVNDIYQVPDSLPNQCGDIGHPWLEEDINRDCRTDMNDVKVLSSEWIAKNCSWLNWNCSGCDINRDTTVNLKDMALLAGKWLNHTLE